MTNAEILKSLRPYFPQCITHFDSAARNWSIEWTIDRSFNLLFCTLYVRCTVIMLRYYITHGLKFSVEMLDLKSANWKYMDFTHCFKFIVHKGKEIADIPSCLGHQDGSMQCDHTQPREGESHTDTWHCCGCEEHIVSSTVVM